MSEGDAGEPVDADMNIGGGLGSAGDIEIAPTGRTGADEDRIETLIDDSLQAVDPLAEARVDPSHPHNVANLLVDHRLG